LRGNRPRGSVEPGRRSESPAEDRFDLKPTSVRGALVAESVVGKRRLGESLRKSRMETWPPRPGGCDSQAGQAAVCEFVKLASTRLETRRRG